MAGVCRVQGGGRSLPAVPAAAASRAAAAPAALEVPSLRAAREWVPGTGASGTSS